MTALVMASVLLILNWQERGGASRALVAGIVAGLAGAMKYNGLGVCVAFGTAWSLRLLDTRRDDPGAAVNQRPRDH
jgi:hypothetical protein